jgi:GT2 family glycosyltransferase
MVRSGEVAVLLLNYKGADDTIACLQALYGLASPPGGVIVVDNASPDDSLMRIHTAWQQWASPQLLREGQVVPHLGTRPVALLLAHISNDGYAAGNNVGIRLAQQIGGFKAFWLLNNDAIPKPEALEALCETCNRSQQPVVVGSTLVFAHDESTIQCTGGSKFISFLGVTHPLHQGGHIAALCEISVAHVEKHLDYVAGASLFIHLDVLKRLDLLREDFFLYLEDTEFCIRARRAGVSMLWARDSIVLHKEGGSTGASSASGCRNNRPAWIDYLMLRNRACLVRDHYPLGLPLLCISYLFVACKRFLRKQPDRIPLVFIALYHGICGKMGKPNFQKSR